MTNQSITRDDTTKTVTLPFTFRFAGTNYTSVKISSNGNAHFSTASTAYNNVAIPNTARPNAMIAAFWDDLNPSPAARSTPLRPERLQTGCL